MRNFTKNLGNFTNGSGLYCVWMLVHDDGGDRLAAIWIDRALTAFKSCAPETSHGICRAVSHFAGHQEEDTDLLVGEQWTSVLPRRS
jgi:hypothetical protein